MVVQKRMMAFIAGGLLGVACILYIVANALPMWTKIHVDEKTIKNIIEQLGPDNPGSPNPVLEQLRQMKPYTGTFGLWDICQNTDQDSYCKRLPNKGLGSTLDAQMNSARAFITIACILSGFATICVVACIYMNENLNIRFTILAKVFSFAALLSGIIGVAVGLKFTFTGQEYLSMLGNSKQIHMAAILAIIALLSNVVGAILSLMIK